MSKIVRVWIFSTDHALHLHAPNSDFHVHLWNCVGRHRNYRARSLRIGYNLLRWVLD